MKKSPAKNKPTSPKKQLEKSLIPASSPQVDKIIGIRDRFRKNIETPIENMQAIQHSQTPQRCLFHNTMLTLYCQIDRKALCANCIYQQDTHRKHRVIPIGRAIAMIKQDIVSYENKLEGNLKQCSSLSHKLQQTIVKNQRYYPSVVDQLKKFYQNMILMLREKERQQVNQILQQHEKIKNQIMFLDHEVKKISGFIANKLKPIKKPQTDDILLTKRGILEVLTKVNKTINEEIQSMFENQQTPNLIDFTLFNDISFMVKNRLVVVLPGISVNPRKGGFQPSHSSHQLQTRKQSPSPKSVDIKKSPDKPKSISNKKNRKQVKFVFD